MKFNEDKLAASLCKDSFYFFVQEFWSEVIPEEPVWNWHIEYLCGVLQDIGIGVKNREPKLYEWVIINIPPGTTKSTIISEMYPAWCWAIDPTQRFICVSNTDKLALELSEYSRTIIKSDKYQKYFPDVIFRQETDSKSHFQNTKGGDRYAASVRSARIGIHAHQIICLHEDELITADVGLLKIGDIVKQKINCKVLSFNHQNNVVEWKNITNFQTNEGRQLVEIETKSGIKIKCTEDHEVWTENRGYVQAKDLKENDTLYTDKWEKRQM